MTVTVTGLILLTRPTCPLARKNISNLAGLLFMIFILESDSPSLPAPIIVHLGIDRDLISTASIKKLRR